MTTFFSLIKYIKYVALAEDVNQKEEDNTIGGKLSSVLKPSIVIPTLATVAVPLYSYASKVLGPDKLKIGLSKLSELVDSLTGTKSIDKPSDSATITSKTSAWQIAPGESSKPSSTRESPAALGMSGKLPDRGTYTKAEANYILGLKAKGIDTSASKTSMHPKVEELIRARAAEHGVDQDIAVKIAIVESGGNPNAISSTGAIGIFQFTGATANLMGLHNRFNIADNIDAGIRLLAADKKFVGKFNTSVATYLSLQIGGPNAKYVLTADRSTKISDLPQKIQSVIRGNIGGKSLSVGEYIDANAAALETKVQEQKSKPVYVYSSPIETPSPVVPSAVVSSKPSLVISKPTSSVVQSTAPTNVPPVYTSAPTTSIESSPQLSSIKQQITEQPRPTLEGVVRHKSGLYFNVS